MAHAAVIDDKSISWVQRVDANRGAVLLAFLVRNHHTDAHAANVHPVSNLFVFSVLTFRAHELIQAVHLGGNRIIPTVGHILKRLPQKISSLKGHNLVRPIDHNLVVDLRADDLLFQADVLPASVIPIQIFSLRRISHVDDHCLANNISYILRRNLLFVCVCHMTPMQSIIRPAKDLICVFQQCITTSRQNKKGQPPR